MPNYIRTKQIDQQDLSGFLIDTISNQSYLISSLASGSASGIILNETVLLTGNQTISGIKNFTSRPKFNGTNLVAEGEGTNFNGARVIKRTSFPYNEIIGGNDVTGFLNNLFFPFIPATLNLNSYSIKELGTTFSSIPFQGIITQNDETIITNLQFLKDNIVIYTTPSPSFGSFSYTSNASSTSATVLSVRLTIDNNNQPSTISSSQQVNFEAPIYYGVGAENLNGTNIKSLFLSNKSVESKSNKTRTFNTDDQKIYFVIPKSWGLLTSIIDPGSNLPYTDAFTYRTEIIKLADNSNYEYYVYESNDKSSVNNFDLTFNF